MAIDIVDTGQDALLEFVFCHPDVAQDRTSELGEEAFDEVEPGAVLGCEGELEASRWSSDQLGETFVPTGRAVLARVAGQQPRGPQLMRIAVLLGLVARQRHQPGFGLRRDDRSLPG